MPPPKEIMEWLNQRYPKPKVDPDWLEGCYSWIEETHELDPATQMDAIIGHVTAQLLSSDFADSMRPKTGLTSNIHALKKCTMKGPPILLELISLTEIAHSAFNLMNVKTRIDREDLAGLGEDIDDQGNVDEDEGPVPRYPRGMLKMELSDGFTTLNAIEYRRIPDLELGVTPLGCKVQIHNVDIRNGVALLEPKNFTVLGYQTEDRVAQQDADFVRSLKRRLKLPEDEPAAPGEAPPAPPPPGPPPAPAPMPAHPRAPSERPMLAQPLRQPPIRSPPREVSAPLEPGPSHAPHIDKEQHRRRKVAARSPSPLLPPPPAQARQTHSRFFHGSGAGSNHRAQDNSDDLAEYLRLSPHRESSRLVNDSEDEIEDWQIAEPSARPRRPPASKTARATEKQTQLAANNQAESDTDVDMAVPTDGSSEFDFDDVGGASFFAEVDKVEKAALSQYAGSQDRTQVGTQVKMEQTQAARSTTGVTNSSIFDTATLVGGSSQSAPGRGSGSSGGSRNPPSSSSRGRGSSVPVDGSSRSQYARVNLGVIDLLDDDEEDREKENIPAQSKYVRRRTATPAAAVYDVIEISD